MIEVRDIVDAIKEKTDMSFEEIANYIGVKKSYLSNLMTDTHKTSGRVKKALNSLLNKRQHFDDKDRVSEVIETKRAKGRNLYFVRLSYNRSVFAIGGGMSDISCYFNPTKAKKFMGSTDAWKEWDSIKGTLF